VTNLAIDLRIFDDPAHAELTKATVDSQWAAVVEVDTIAKNRAHIPRVEGLPRDRRRYCRPSEASRLITDALRPRPSSQTPEELFDEIYRGEKKL
jgi:hypothetical protein